MKLLLDTHVWLWYSLGNPQLSENLRSIIASDATELWLSSISIWEILILVEKGRSLGKNYRPIDALKH